MTFAIGLMRLFELMRLFGVVRSFGVTRLFEVARPVLVEAAFVVLGAVGSPRRRSPPAAGGE
jgi:hypothetical protein